MIHDRHTRAKAALAFVNDRLADARDRVRTVEASLKDAQYQLAQAEFLADLATREAIECGEAAARSGPVVATPEPKGGGRSREGDFIPDDEMWR